MDGVPVQEGVVDDLSRLKEMSSKFVVTLSNFMHGLYVNCSPLTRDSSESH